MKIVDLSKFTAGMDEESGEIDALVGAVSGKIGLDVLTRVVHASPVGNPTLWKNPPPPGYVGGRFRGNWQVDIDRIPTGETGRIDPSGGETISVGTAAAANAKPYVLTYIVNNVPYGERLNGGHSKQAPAGFVEASIDAAVTPFE